jgi:hypothetical protein
MDELDTEVLPWTGAHRAPASSVRRALPRVAAASVAVAGVVALGWFTADAVGLAGAESVAADTAVVAPGPEEVEAPPRRVGVSPSTRAEDPPAPVVDAVPAADPAQASARPLVGEPQAAPAPSVLVVTPNDRCDSPGAVGTTANGKPMVCQSHPGGGPVRWRNA